MLVTSLLASSILFLAPGALAAPVEQRAGAVTNLDAAAQKALVPIANFARASYCSAASVQSWSCGAACAAAPGVKGIASGGNDDLIPGWFVAYDPASKSIIVAHQGTNPTSFLSVLTDIVLSPGVLREDLFPGSLAAGVKVHSGFMTVQALTASKILAAVKTGVKTYGTNKVITTGHSLGAAIASLDAVYLKLADPSLSVSYVGFGQPRVGNDGFARFHKSIVPNSKHVTNKADPVPRLPGTFLGFSQLDGEVWIDGTTVKACSGFDNPDCAISVSPLKFNAFDHGGPFFGVSMGPLQCTA